VVVTQLACVCDARGLVGGLCVRWCRRRRACTACGASVVCVVARAGCSVWLGRGCGGSSGEVGLDCVFVCFTRGVLVVGVCAGAGSVWLWWVGAEVRGRVVGGAVVLSSAVRALRWFDVSLTYLGVCAGRQVGGVGQWRQDGARLGRGHGEGGAAAGGSLCRRHVGVVLTGTSLSSAGEAVAGAVGVVGGCACVGGLVGWGPVEGCWCCSPEAGGGVCMRGVYGSVGIRVLLVQGWGGGWGGF
jgi:hypothetical protein